MLAEQQDLGGFHIFVRWNRQALIERKQPQKSTFRKSIALATFSEAQGAIPG